MRSIWAYSFLTGMFIGGYTNLFSKAIITGLVLYIVNPENFNISRFTPLYYRISDFSYPYISKIYSFSNKPSLESSSSSLSSPRISVLDSPANTPLIPKLPPLYLK